jgi:hypothetical protein
MRLASQSGAACATPLRSGSLEHRTSKRQSGSIERIARVS